MVEDSWLEITVGERCMLKRPPVAVLGQSRDWRQTALALACTSTFHTCSSLLKISVGDPIAHHSHWFEIDVVDSRSHHDVG